MRKHILTLATVGTLLGAWSSDPVPAAGGGGPSSPTPQVSSSSGDVAVELLAGPPASSAAPAPTSAAPRPALSKKSMTSYLGWALTRSNTGLAAVGLTCDGLPRYTGSSSPAAGTVISGVRIETGLNLFAGNITIERSCIRPTSLSRGAALVTTTGPCTGDNCAVTPAEVKIIDSDFDGTALPAQTIAKSCAFLGVGVLQRNYLHGMGTGICFFNTGRTLNALAEGNYVRGLRSWGDPTTDGSHNEGATVRDFVTSSNPQRQVVFRNNRLDSTSGNDTGALFIQTWGGEIDNLTVEGNLLEGGGYQLGLESVWDNAYGRNLRAINNRFSGSGWGPCYVTDNGLGYGWSQWTDNFINDPAQPDNRGRRIANP